MKKTLTLVKNNLNYELKISDKVIITIIDKKINGVDIFDKVYNEVPANTKTNITINHELEMEGGKIKIKEDRLMYDQIKLLFLKIDEAIKDTVVASKE